MLTTTQGTYIAGFAFALTTVFASAAVAQEDRPPRPERRGPGHNIFNRADTNGDGKLTYDEASAVMHRMNEDVFSHMDSNSDGVLTQDELGPRREPRPGGGAQRFAELDENNDHKLSFDEFSAEALRRAREHFGQLDTDDDGYLTAEELATGHRRGDRGPERERDRRQ